MCWVSSAGAGVTQPVSEAAADVEDVTKGVNVNEISQFFTFKFLLLKAPTM